MADVGSCRRAGATDRRWHRHDGTRCHGTGWMAVAARGCRQVGWRNPQRTWHGMPCPRPLPAATPRLPPRWLVQPTPDRARDAMSAAGAYSLRLPPHGRVQPQGPVTTDAASRQPEVATTMAGATTRADADTMAGWPCVRLSHPASPMVPPTADAVSCTKAGAPGARLFAAERHGIWQRRATSPCTASIL